MSWFKMPKVSKGHDSGQNNVTFFLKFNHVIYSSSPISWPSCKPLAQILFEISCWQDFILIFSKGHNSRKGDNSDKKKYGSAIFPWGIHIWNPSMHIYKIWHASAFILIFFKGHNSRKGDNVDKKKKHVSAIFPWGIHIWNFKTLACTVHKIWHACFERTHTRTTRNPYAQSTSSKLGTWGHKNEIIWELKSGSNWTTLTPSGPATAHHDQLEQVPRGAQIPLAVPLLKILKQFKSVTLTFKISGKSMDHELVHYTSRY